MGRRLRQIFTGAAMLYGSFLVPGYYYNNIADSEQVRARIMGRGQLDDGATISNYMIYTDQGVFAVQGKEAADYLKDGQTYDLTLQGATYKLWPPSATRCIVDAVTPSSPETYPLRKAAEKAARDLFMRQK